MKKSISFLIIIIVLFSLSGCASVSSNHRSVEKLLVMETMGLDRHSQGVLVSLSSAAIADESGERSAPVRLSCVGASINSAIERMHAHSTGKELFCAHTTHVLIGEDSARKGVEPFLSYICRSPDMRLDVPVFIVRGESAETAVKRSGDDKSGITELLGSAKDNLDSRGGGRIFPAAELLRDIERYGGGLASAIECTPKKEGEELKEGCSVDIYGYAVLRGWNLCSFIPKSKTIGVDFLKNDVDICDITSEASSVGVVTYEISSGDCRISPVWDDTGALTGLNISANVSASVIELNGNASAANDELIALLESSVSSQISYALELSKNLGVDFLGLAGQLDAADPYKFRRLETGLAEILPSLQVQVSVSGKLTHTNDVKGL